MSWSCSVETDESSLLKVLFLNKYFWFPFERFEESKDRVGGLLGHCDEVSKAVCLGPFKRGCLSA